MRKYRHFNITITGTRNGGRLTFHATYHVESIIDAIAMAIVASGLGLVSSVDAREI